jgi:hypothetical protein
MRWFYNGDSEFQAPVQNINVQKWCNMLQHAFRSVCKHFVRFCVLVGEVVPHAVCVEGLLSFGYWSQQVVAAFANAMLCPLARMEKDHTIYRPILKCYLIPLPHIYRPLRQRSRLHPRAWWWAPRAIAPNRSLGANPSFLLGCSVHLPVPCVFYLSTVRPPQHWLECLSFPFGTIMFFFLNFRELPILKFYPFHSAHRPPSPRLCPVLSVGKFLSCELL